MKSITFSTIAFAMAIFAGSLPLLGSELFSSPSIQWEGDVLKAYEEALRRKKPLVLVMAHPPGHEGCVHCAKLRRELYSKAMDVLSGQAVFAITHRDKDEVSGLLYKKLGFQSYPVISVIEPRNDRIKEMIRINGFFPAEKVIEHLRPFLAKY